MAPHGLVTWPRLHDLQSEFPTGWNMSVLLLAGNLRLTQLPSLVRRGGLSPCRIIPVVLAAFPRKVSPHGLGFAVVLGSHNNLKAFVGKIWRTI